MGYTGAYTMDLYCDWKGCLDPLTSAMPNSKAFVGRNYRDCVKQAKKLGWIVRRDRDFHSELGSGRRYTQRAIKRLAGTSGGSSPETGGGLARPPRAARASSQRSRSSGVSN